MKTTVENALYDFRAISSMGNKNARELAARQGVEVEPDYTSSEVAHAVILKAYGKATYTEARRILFSTIHR